MCHITFTIILVSFSLLLFFLPAKVNLSYKKNQYQQNASIVIDFQNIFCFNIKVPIFYNRMFGSKKEKNYPNDSFLYSKIHRFTSSFQYLSRFLKIIKFLLKTIHLKSVDLKICLHNNNPAITSILAGVYWCATGFFLSFLSSKIDFNNVDVSIKIIPLFVKKKDSEIFFNSIFYLKVGYIIIISIITVILILYYKFWLSMAKKE